VAGSLGAVNINFPSTFIYASFEAPKESSVDVVYTWRRAYVDEFRVASSIVLAVDVSMFIRKSFTILSCSNLEYDYGSINY